MRVISFEQIAETVAGLCIEANVRLPGDVRRAIETARSRETSELGASILGTLIENMNCAAATGLPVCQDTGIAVVFADVGQDAHIEGGLFSDAVNEGVRRGYLRGYLRNSVVSDPLRRTNTGDNTPAVLHTTLVGGDRLNITVAPKGFGSENMCALKMLSPTSSASDIVDFVVGSVRDAGSNPCPPVIVGVGLGGTAECAMLASKRALLLPCDGASDDQLYSGLERDILSAVNGLGIGPQGFGGITTALGCRIVALPTHIAGLPCAVSIGCHVTRHASCVI